MKSAAGIWLTYGFGLAVALSPLLAIPGCVTTYLPDPGQTSRVRNSANLAQRAWHDLAPDSGVSPEVVRAEVAEMCRSSRAQLAAGGAPDAGPIACGAEP